VAQLQEELRQERSRRTKLLAEKQDLEVKLAMAEQRLDTQAAAAKKVSAELESKLVEAASTQEGLLDEREALLALGRTSVDEREMSKALLLAQAQADEQARRAAELHAALQQRTAELEEMRQAKEKIATPRPAAPTESSATAEAAAPREEGKAKPSKPDPPATTPAMTLRTKFPLLTAAYCESNNLLLLGGGGGSAKTGTTNTIMLCSLSNDGILERARHLSGAEAATSLTVSPDGKFIACVLQTRLILFQVQAGEVFSGPPLQEAQQLELSPEEKGGPAALPYKVSFSPNGTLLAVGMEDGGVYVFCLEAASWRLRWQQKAHSKEVKDCAFTADGSLLCTLAPDGVCLAWPLASGGARAAAPSPVAQPSFWLHQLTHRPSNKRKRQAGAQWRSVALPASAPLLFGALNHTGGPGWVARCELRGLTCEAYARLAASPVTAIALDSAASIVAAATSEGELFVLDARSLARLYAATPHSLFVTSLLLCSAHSPCGRAAITCAGDNSCVLTPLPPAALRPARRPWILYISVIVTFLAVCLAARPLQLAQITKGSPVNTPFVSPEE